MKTTIRLHLLSWKSDRDFCRLWCLYAYTCFMISTFVFTFCVHIRFYTGFYSFHNNVTENARRQICQWHQGFHRFSFEYMMLRLSVWTVPVIVSVIACENDGSGSRLQNKQPNPLVSVQIQSISFRASLVALATKHDSTFSMSLPLQTPQDVRPHHPCPMRPMSIVTNMF